MQRSTIDEQPGHVYHPGMTEPRRVRFLFDYISPYAYLGWIEIRQIAERAGVVVEPVPVLFAAMLNTHGHLGPAEIAPKRIYIFKDVLRRAHRLGVPLVPPPAHPFNPLLALRVTTACAPDDRERLMDALFASTWGGAEPRGVERLVGRRVLEHRLDRRELGLEPVEGQGLVDVDDRRDRCRRADRADHDAAERVADDMGHPEHVELGHHGDDVAGHRFEVVPLGRPGRAVAPEIHRDHASVRQQRDDRVPAGGRLGDAVHEQGRWAVATVVGVGDRRAVGGGEGAHAFQPPCET